MPEERVLLLTGAALKLAAHLARCYPLDLLLLEPIILPLLGTEVARQHYKDAVDKVKQDDARVVVKGRKKKGRQLKWRVGDVVRTKEGWVGVVAGWDKSFDEAMCGEYFLQLTSRTELTSAEHFRVYQGRV